MLQGSFTVELYKEHAPKVSSKAIVSESYETLTLDVFLDLP